MADLIQSNGEVVRRVFKVSLSDEAMLDFMTETCDVCSNLLMEHGANLINLLGNFTRMYFGFLQERGNRLPQEDQLAVTILQAVQEKKLTNRDLSVAWAAFNFGFSAGLMVGHQLEVDGKVPSTN